MLEFLDISGTLVFALSGAFRAVKYELDLLGVLVLAVATGVGGGIFRDLLLGYTPPAAFRDERYLLVSIFGGLLVFFAARRLAAGWDYVMAADAVGLGVFAAIGAGRAAEAGLGMLGIILIAGITATGGGVIRDLLVCEIPAVIRTDFYATAALIGGCAFVMTRALDFSPAIQLGSAIVITTGLRLLAMKYKFGLPRIRRLPASPSQLADHRHHRSAGNRNSSNSDG